MKMIVLTELDIAFGMIVPVAVTGRVAAGGALGCQGSRKKMPPLSPRQGTNRT